jgi:hypothetical protein
MERLLLLWDELDDLAWACRHLAASAAGEVAGLGSPVAVAAATLGGALLAGATMLHAGLLHLSSIV